MRNISRRDLFKIGGTAAVGVAGAGMLASCAPTIGRPRGDYRGSVECDTAGTGTETTSMPAFLAKPEAVVEFAETKDYDVVVVGAGVSGMAAAVSAAQAGAKVACVQKESEPSSQGNMAASVDFERLGEAGKQALLSFLTELNQHRSDRALLEAWADNSSAAALTRFREAAAEGGIEVNEEEPQAPERRSSPGGERLRRVPARPTPTSASGTGEVVKASRARWPHGRRRRVLLQHARRAARGGRGRHRDGRGRAQAARTAPTCCSTPAKGVVLGHRLTTGCDEEMVAHYCPDLRRASRRCMVKNRTGDGHEMGVWAGGEIERRRPHQDDAPRRPRRAAPTPRYLLVNYLGERCMCRRARCRGT